MRQDNAVLLHPDVNTDPTFRCCTPLAREIFLRLLPFLDEEGRLPADKRITLAMNVHQRLGIPAEGIGAAISDLVDHDLVRVEGERLSVPKFRARQDQTLLLLADLLERRTAPSPSLLEFLARMMPLMARAGLINAAQIPSEPPLRQEAVLAPARRAAGGPAKASEAAPNRVPGAKIGRDVGPTGRPLRHPFLSDSETEEQRQTRIRRERNERHRKASARKSGAETPKSAGPSQTVSPGPSQSVSKRLAETVSPGPSQTVSTPARAPESGSGNSGSPDGTTTKLPSSSSSGSDPERAESSQRTVSPSPGDWDGMASSTQTMKTMTVSSSRSAEDILTELGRTTQGRFLPLANLPRLLELQQLEARLDAAKVRPDRWTVLGEYIMAGGFCDLTHHRFVRRVNGVKVMIPDLQLLIVPSTAAVGDADERTTMDSSRLLAALQAAVGWDENGRPDPTIAGRGKFSGGMAKVVPQSDDQGRATAERLLESGGRGSVAAGAVSIGGRAVTEMMERALSGRGPVGAGGRDE